MSKRKDQITAEDFVKAWQAADSLSSAADALGISKEYCSYKAYCFRSAGIELKKFPRGSGRRLDVKRLNKLAAQVSRP